MVPKKKRKYLSSVAAAARDALYSSSSDSSSWSSMFSSNEILTWFSHHQKFRVFMAVVSQEKSTLTAKFKQANDGKVKQHLEEALSRVQDFYHQKKNALGS